MQNSKTSKTKKNHFTSIAFFLKNSYKPAHNAQTIVLKQRKHFCTTTINHQNLLIGRGENIEVNVASA